MQDSDAALAATQNDPDVWGDPIEIVTKPSGYTVIRARIPDAVFRQMEYHRTQTGLSLSDYVGTAILAYATKGPADV